VKNSDDIAKALGTQSHGEAVSFFEQLLKNLEILPPQNVGHQDLEILTNSVNPQRLQNTPAHLDEVEIKNLYKEILEV
jgi:alcohol dehydrogenase class IV